jgi:hypothetical protein
MIEDGCEPPSSSKLGIKPPPRNLYVRYVVPRYEQRSLWWQSLVHEDHTSLHSRHSRVLSYQHASIGVRARAEAWEVSPLCIKSISIQNRYVTYSTLVEQSKYPYHCSHFHSPVSAVDPLYSRVIANCRTNKSMGLAEGGTHDHHEMQQLHRINGSLLQHLHSVTIVGRPADHWTSISKLMRHDYSMIVNHSVANITTVVAHSLTSKRLVPPEYCLLPSCPTISQSLDMTSATSEIPDSPSRFQTLFLKPKPTSQESMPSVSLVLERRTKSGEHTTRLSSSVAPFSKASPGAFIGAFAPWRLRGR